MSFPLCIQRDPLMGRLDSVKLQVRIAEVWLLTSGGSAMMFGASDKQKREKNNYYHPFLERKFSAYWDLTTSLKV